MQRDKLAYTSRTPLSHYAACNSLSITFNTIVSVWCFGCNVTVDYPVAIKRKTEGGKAKKITQSLEHREDGDARELRGRCSFRASLRVERITKGYTIAVCLTGSKVRLKLEQPGRLLRNFRGTIWSTQKNWRYGTSFGEARARCPVRTSPRCGGLCLWYLWYRWVAIDVGTSCNCDKKKRASMREKKKKRR